MSLAIRVDSDIFNPWRRDPEYMAMATSSQELFDLPKGKKGSVTREKYRPPKSRPKRSVNGASVDH